MDKKLPASSRNWATLAVAIEAQKNWHTGSQSRPANDTPHPDPDQLCADLRAIIEEVLAICDEEDFRG
jgi:hypothetical protein